MRLGFREKFAWLTIVGMLGIYGYYFARVLPPRGADVSVADIALLSVLLSLLVIVFIVGAIIMAIPHSRAGVQEDERDAQVGLKGTRNGSYVLASGAVMAILCALLTEGNFWFVHVMLASLVLAQLMESASCLFYYRRGS